MSSITRIKLRHVIPITLCANAILVPVPTIANARAVLKVAVMVVSAPLKESIVLSDAQAPVAPVALSKQRFADLLLELNHV
jgi:hypothetical protein